jgi:hypothetical protein
MSSGKEAERCFRAYTRCCSVSLRSRSESGGYENMGIVFFSVSI